MRQLIRQAFRSQRSRSSSANGPGDRSRSRHTSIGTARHRAGELNAPWFQFRRRSVRRLIAERSLSYCHRQGPGQPVFVRDPCANGRVIGVNPGL